LGYFQAFLKFINSTLQRNVVNRYSTRAVLYLFNSLLQLGKNFCNKTYRVNNPNKKILESRSYNTLRLRYRRSTDPKLWSCNYKEKLLRKIIIRELGSLAAIKEKFKRPRCKNEKKKRAVSNRNSPTHLDLLFIHWSVFRIIVLLCLS